MAPLEDLLQQVGYHFARAQPFIPTYLHVLCSALIVIYTGAHASLTIPNSAAKPPKKEKKTSEDEEDEPSDTLEKMEGLSPSDALMFPLLAGCTLAGLYFLIKWLEDPAILNKILNWYFSVFGVLSVARLFTDTMAVCTSFVFPRKYRSGGETWEIKRKQRIAESTAAPQLKRTSPLPGIWSKLPLPSYALDTLWRLREFPSKRVHVRAYIHRIMEASLHLGVQGSISFVLALAAVLYYNLVAKPWWLTNILGYSFAYTALLFMSPTTFSTGSLILGALFVYDIYFVFYTPMMVTVATKIDIPAKMLFPRPADPGADPAKSLAMLGLGDIVLPGIVMGSALRFDLYMFYFRKQKRRDFGHPGSSDGQTESKVTMKDGENENELENSHTAERGKPASEIIKAPYQTATGSWGERFWLSSFFPFLSQTASPPPGVSFPKPYFHATLFGYTVGMLITLTIMQVFGHAQPALFYLVPGVLVSLWGTALIRGELKEMWKYDETDEDEKGNRGEQNTKEGGAKDNGKREGKKSIFSWARQDEIAKRLRDATGAETKGEEGREASKTEDGAVDANQAKDTRKRGFFRDRQTELIFFSVNLPKGSSSDENAQLLSEEQADGADTALRDRPSG